MGGDRALPGQRYGGLGNNFRKTFPWRETDGDCKTEDPEQNTIDSPPPSSFHVLFDHVNSLDNLHVKTKQVWISLLSTWGYV